MDGIALMWSSSLISTFVLLVGLVLLIATVVVWYRMGGKRSSAAPLDRVVESLWRQQVQGQISFDEFERLCRQLETPSKPTRKTA